MKFLIIVLVAVAYANAAMNPALITSNTAPGTDTNKQQMSNQQMNNQQQATFTPRRPVYRDGMLNPINYTPYRRSAPSRPMKMNARDASDRYNDSLEDDDMMRILPYPAQYDTQNRYQYNNNQYRNQYPYNQQYNPNMNNPGQPQILPYYPNNGYRF